MATTVARNKRRRDRIRLIKSTKLQISTHPGSNRTLRRSARKELRQQFDRYHCILPWVKDPWYRYRPNEHPPASLLMRLPTEVLQTILLDTISPIDLEAWTWEMMKKWASVLRCISPLVRVRMDYVQQVWKSRKDDVEAAQLAKQKSTWSLADLCVSRGAGTRDAPSRIGSELRVKRRKRKRDRKCWYCEQRHHSVDPICPMARRSPHRWRQLTKEVRTKQQVVAEFFGEEGYQGSKITFED